MTRSSFDMPSIFPVTCHTDFVGKDSVFVAIKGYADNGISYIKKAVEKGARTIVIHNGEVLDDELIFYINSHKSIVQRVDDTRQALADLSAKYAGNPAKKLKIIGITGTKGKTTTAFLLEYIMRSAGYRTALISSARNRIMEHEFSSPLTTPQPDYLQQFLKMCVDNDVEYVVMEVAAQALSLHRVRGIKFDGLIFTNFSHEHLEFYSTLEDYFKAKCLLFNMIKKDTPCLINADDDHGQQLLERYKNTLSYGFQNTDVYYLGMHSSYSTKAINLHVAGKKVLLQNNVINCPVLFGQYNGYNVLAAVSMALELKIDIFSIKNALSSFGGVPGRLQYYLLPNGARSFIDYAHNPDSFSAVLSALRLLTDKLIVIFGAGGGRDKIKRPLMGKIAADIADEVILTTDNPRMEDATSIVADIQAGIPDCFTYKVTCILDREEAIRYAYSNSSSGSIIALLGKGPDEYQIVGATKHYFSEHTILQQL